MLAAVFHSAYTTMLPATRLSHLPTRPPTPPKELSSDPALPTTTGKASAVLTPDSLSSRSPVRGIKRKRVNFILTPTSGNASSPFSLPQIPSSNSYATSSPKQPSREGKPGRSILKVTNNGRLSNITLNSDDLGVTLNFSSPLTWKSDKLKMLDEIFTQLASSDKSARLDAYQSLAAAMKKYNDMPKFEEFIRRVPALFDFIRRDLELRKGDDHRDGQLSHEALKLATLLAWRDPATLSDSAKEVLLDQCIEVLVDTTASKLLTNNCLFLLSCQSFNKNLNQPRVVKILKALSKIDERVSGSQVKSLRVDTYRKFVSQCPKAMTGNVGLWLVPLMEGMLSDRNDVATKALSCGREAATKLGSELEVSKAMEQLLKTTIPVRTSEKACDKEQNNSSTPKIYAEHLVSRLQRIAKDKSRSELVPQIWSVVILFLQRRRSVLTKAPTKEHLFRLLQFCLNKVPITTKTRAIIAWRDLIYTLRAEMHQDRATLDLLSLVFAGAFQRNDGEKARNEVETTYCTFLYFAIWPKASTETITWVWNKRITSLLKMDNPKSHVRPEFALRVIGALLGTQQQVGWDAEKALSGPPLQPEDLPRIEPKWVVANIDSILDVLENHIKAAGSETDASVYTVWDAFNRCIVETRSHEIRPSSVTMTALASMLSFALKYASEMDSSRPVTDQKSRPLACLSRLLFGTFSTFGLIPCNEKVLSVDEHNVVHANESAKSTDGTDGTHSGIDIALVMLLSSCLTPCEPPSAFGDLLGLIIDRKLAAGTNCSKRLQILAELSESSLCDGPHVPGNQAHRHCLRTTHWEQISKRLLETLKNYSSSDASPDSQSRGADFTHIVTILINGVDHAASLKMSWFQAWDLLLTEAKASLDESAHLAIANAIFEPLAKGLLERMASAERHVRSEAGVDIVCRVLRSVEWPETTDTQQQAQRALWGSMSANTRLDARDPYSSVYDLFLLALDTDLARSSSSRVDRAVTVFVDSCPAPFFWNMLQNVAPGLGRWLCNKVNDDPEPAYWFKLSRKIQGLWSIKNHDSLSALKPILLAGLASTVHEVVTEYVALWDNTVSSAVRLENGSEFAQALTKAKDTLAKSKVASSQIISQTSPVVPPSSQGLSTKQASATSLHNSPSRREWLLNESPRQSRAHTSEESTQHLLVTVQPEPSGLTVSRVDEDILPAPAPQTHSTSAPHRCVTSSIALNLTPIKAGLDHTHPVVLEPELPSSPPEVSREPELPTLSSDDVDQANIGVDQALPMSDEFRDLDYSPTPLVRRPFSAGRSDMGVFDLPDSSPIQGSTHLQMHSDPTGNNATAAASKKQPKSRMSKQALRSSKHFPINLEAENTMVPRHAQSTKNAAPVQQQAADVQTTPFVNNFQAKNQDSEIIDVDALPEKTGSKRKQTSTTIEHEQPPQKRGRGRPRKVIDPVSSSQPTSQEMEGTRSQQRGSPSRPKKTAIPLPRKYPTTLTAQTSQSDDDMEDTIEIAQSQPQPSERGQSRRAKPRRNKDEVVVDVLSSAPKSAQDGERNTRSKRNKAPSIGSVEIVRDSFKNDDKGDKTNEKGIDAPVKRRNSKARKTRSSSAHQQGNPTEQEVISKDRNAPSTVSDIFSGIADHDNDDAHEEEQEVLQKRGGESNGKKRKSPSSPSSQLHEALNPTTPKKKRRSAAADEDGDPSPQATPQSPLSKAAQNILAKLRGLLDGVQGVVLGRSEARTTTKVLNEIAAIVPQISNAVMDAEERGENDAEV